VFRIYQEGYPSRRKNGAIAPDEIFTLPGGAETSDLEDKDTTVVE